MFKRLGTFKPTSLDQRDIVDEFKDFLRDHGLRTIYVGIRTPEHHIEYDAPTASHDSIRLWHHDCNTDEGDDVLMAVWSSIDPTEIQMLDGSVFQPDPNEVVVFDNRTYAHRKPAKVHASERWFIRAYIFKGVK